MPTGNYLQFINVLVCADICLLRIFKWIINMYVYMITLITFIALNHKIVSREHERDNRASPCPSGNCRKIFADETHNLTRACARILVRVP